MVINVAVWDENTLLNFSDGAGSSSTVSETGNRMVVAKKIDSVIECADINFLKMDIEGSEYNALLGAKRLICNNMPILAICMYHSNEDMIRIFELIKSWDLNYKYYIRHHAQKTSETVLYAIPNR